VLHVSSRLPPDTVLPIGWIGAGDPAALFSPDRHDELWAVQRELDFPGTVYGVPRGTPMRELMARQAAFFGAHADDRIVG
jgi:gamma-carbonic anhydrase